jgi:Zn-dependent protease with chaperone function
VNKYDLGSKDFVCKSDLDAIKTIQVTGFLPHLLRQLTLADFEKSLLSELSEKAFRIDLPSDLDRMARQCANTLSLQTLPELFVVDGSQLNAFTFGSEENAHIVITSALLKTVSAQELMAVMGHEFGHVKSGHLLYHTLAEALATGLGMSASFLGMNAISIPLRLALLAWHRASEITADRASLLVVNDVEVLMSLFPKLASRANSGSFGHRKMDNEGANRLQTLGELVRTHPLDSNRIKLAREFWQSSEFKSGRRKIEKRQRLLKALVPVCRFCGRGKPIEALFCANCGKSQT